MPQILSSCLRLPSYASVFLQSLRFQEFQAQLPHLDTHAAVTVFKDSDTYWAADDLEFVLAAQEIELNIEVRVESGDERIAALHYMKSLATRNILRNTKLLAEVLLNDNEWKQWPDDKIAEFCNLTLNQVKQLRGSVAACEVLTATTNLSSDSVA